MTDETVPEMAERIERRWEELGYRTLREVAEAAGLTRTALDNVRDGKRRQYHASTINGIARALCWRRDWYERILAGDEPVRVESAWRPIGRPPTLDEIQRELIELRDRVSELEGRQPRPPGDEPTPAGGSRRPRR